MRERLSADEWAELVDEWERTGGTAVGFAEAHGVAEASLRWWRTELARRGKRGRGRPPKAQPVALARVIRGGEPAPKEAGSGGTVAVVVGSARIIVEPGFDAALLRAVVDALAVPR